MLDSFWMGILIEFSMGGLVLESGPLLVCVRYISADPIWNGRGTVDYSVKSTAWTCIVWSKRAPRVILDILE